jgi:arylformamidase
MMRDISIELREGTPPWPGDTPYSCTWSWRISAGASVNVSAIALSPHAGTHADTPLHVTDGAPASESLPLESFVGPARVVGAEDAPATIEFDWLEPRLEAGAKLERLLLRTGKTIAGGSFPDEWPTVTPECVAELARRGLRLFGVDAPSVDDRHSRELPNHHAIFGAGAVILENLDLRGVADGGYQLLALPLRIAGLDATPVRAALVEPTP